MKNKKPNKCVLNLKNQINNSLVLLEKLKLVRYYNIIEEEYIFDDNIDDYIFRLSWKNHSGGRKVSSKSFLEIEQYLEILNSGAYHAILYDYSIIRVSFSFYKNNLVSQNLLWWPCPVKIDFQDEEYDSYVDIVKLFLSEEKYFRMRSPIRIDLDTTNNKPDHPMAHMHTQHPESRINIEEPICFNSFIKFIINNYYPSIKIKNKDFSSMNLKHESSSKVEYLSKDKLLIYKSY